MKTFKQSLLFAAIVLLAVSCVQQPVFHSVKDSQFVYGGRVDSLGDTVVLINSAASVTAYFSGDTCAVYLRNHNPYGEHNFFAVELDSQYLGRVDIEGDTTIAFPIKISVKKDVHKISIVKLTEASNGYIDFVGMYCGKLQTPPAPSKHRIEFIGNSITCGFGNDTTEVKCDKGLWFDTHNAYYAYGPVVARELGVDYLLSSVSGIGMYCNWNGVGPVMPQVYNNLYLNLDSTKPFDAAKFNPEIISIALGTNDMSDGDSIHKRLPFDSAQFTSAYIKFVQMLLDKNPNAQVTLLTSPMLSGEKHELLLRCLNSVKASFADSSYKPIKIFVFNPMTPTGCDFHPSMAEDKIMADELYPFYKKLLEQFE